jgi:hypothetical protein
LLPRSELSKVGDFLVLAVDGVVLFGDRLVKEACLALLV